MTHDRSGGNGRCRDGESVRQSGVGGVVGPVELGEVEILTAGEARARDARERELARRRGKADAEKVRRERLSMGGAALDAVLSRPYAGRYLTAAMRFMSRRGIARARKWAMSDDPRIAIPMLRILTDCCRALESIRLTEMSLGLREREMVPGERRIVQATWPDESQKG